MDICTPPQVTIEQIEAINEELQNINKELLASNEELHTANAELKNKIKEITTASTEMDNILRSTNVAAISVDNDLNIRFFTPSIAPIYSLMATDIGRPIQNFTHALDNGSLIKDIKVVICKSEEYKCKVHSQDGRWYSLKILPNLTSESEATGAIIILVDITEAREDSDKLRETDERLNLALRSGDIGVWRWDINEDVVDADEMTLRVFRISNPEELKDYSQFINFVYLDDQKKVAEAVQESKEQGKDYDIEFRVIHSNKAIHHVAVRGRVHTDSNTRHDYMIGVCWDITERVRSNERMVELEGLDVVMDDVTDGWWGWNAETNENYLSLKFKAMFGYDDHEMESSMDAWKNIMFPEDLKVVEKNLSDHIKEKGRSPFRQEVRYHHKDGHTVWVICRGKAILDSSGKFARIIGTHTDITALKEAESRLNAMAMYDSLTTLPNRNSFMAYLPKAIERAKRSGNQMALFYIDLDNFKHVNDTFGHKTGDKLLIAVADRLKHSARTIDFVARLGGDEFAMIIEGVDLRDKLETIAQRCIKAISNSFLIDSYGIDTSLSVGVAVYPHAGKTPEELLQHADFAMYRAKERGKNTVSFFDAKSNERIQRRQLIEMEMKRGILAGEFYVVYQPQLSIQNKKLVGIEALLRWSNKDLQSPGPEEFIPVAELSDQIKVLGKFVLNQAMKDYSSLTESFPYLTPILSINVSAVQISDDAFIEEVTSAISKNKFLGENLMLELTETSLMQHIETTKHTFEKLNKHKVRFALDDFGVGYSSMQYLKHLPIACLKIDQSFVRGVDCDKNDMAIIKAIIFLAKGLNLTTIAEGVETETQLNYLKEQGCHQIQGHYYAKPMPIEKFIEFVKAESLA